MTPKGSLLLIDEIGKADVGLPKVLLEALGSGDFSVPYLNCAVGLPTEA